MKKFLLRSAQLAGLLIVSVVMFSCSSSDSPTEPAENFTVIETFPADGAVNVPIGTAIWARFSANVDANSFTGQTFTVSNADGSWSGQGTTATFVAENPLETAQAYTITLTTGVASTDGKQLASPHTWSFTTESAPVLQPWQQAYGQPTFPFREKTYFSHVAVDGNNYYGFGADNTQAYVVKTDAQGDAVWTRSFGAAISYTNEAFVVLNNGCLFAYTNQDVGVEVVRLDDSGTTQVQSTISEVGTMRIYDMIEATDGNFVMAGVNLRTEGTEPLMTFWSAKIDADANVLWQHAYADSVEIDEVTGIVETPDGGFLITGSNWGLDGRGIAMRADATGTRLWIKKLDGSILNMTPYAIVPAVDGGYILAGTHLQGSQAEGFLAKIDENANTLWSYYGRDDGTRWGEYMKLEDVVVVPGGYVAAGHDGPVWTDVNALLVMFGVTGNILWEERIGGSRNEYLRSVTALPDGTLLGAGYTNAFSANVDDYQAYMLKHVLSVP